MQLEVGGDRELRMVKGVMCLATKAGGILNTCISSVMCSLYEN